MVQSARRSALLEKTSRLPLSSGTRQPLGFPWLFRKPSSSSRSLRSSSSRSSCSSVAPRDDFGDEAAWPTLPGDDRVVEWSATGGRVSRTVVNRQGHHIAFGHTKARAHRRTVRIVRRYRGDREGDVMVFDVIDLRVLFVDCLQRLAFG